MIGQANAGFTQPPIGNSFQPGGGNSQVGTAEQQPKENTIQPQSSPVANTQKQEQESFARQEDSDQAIQVANEDRANNPADARSSDNQAERGSFVDIQV